MDMRCLLGGSGSLCLGWYRLSFLRLSLCCCHGQCIRLAPCLLSPPGLCRCLVCPPCLSLPCWSCLLLSVVLCSPLWMGLWAGRVTGLCVMDGLGRLDGPHGLYGLGRVGMMGVADDVGGVGGVGGMDGIGWMDGMGWMDGIGWFCRAAGGSGMGV